MRLPHRLSALFLALACLLPLTACGGTSAPPAEGPDALPSPPPETANPPEEDVTVYDCGGLRVALPNEYLDLLRVDTDFPDAGEGWTPLISVYEKASYEAAERDFGGGAGFLFGFLSMDQAALEQHVNYDGDFARVFAAGGERYYALTGPTDVQFYRQDAADPSEWKTWEKLCELGPLVREDFLTRNGLQPFSAQDAASPILADREGQVCVRYYPYFVKDGDTRIYYQLLLRQPVRQGEGGLWTVDYWLDERGAPYLYFPDTGVPAAEYYANLQSACDAGEQPELLTPLGAARAFVRDYFSRETLDGSFEEAEGVDRNYGVRNSRLLCTVMDVKSGESADWRKLLDCVGQAAADNWDYLSWSLYGSDWFGPLMEAVENAAVGEDQQRRDSMIISCFLATRDAKTDFRTPLSAILKTQFEADSQAFLTALAEFSDKEQILIESAAGFSTHLLGAVVPDGLTGAMAPPDTPEAVDRLPEPPEIP